VLAAIGAVVCGCGNSSYNPTPAITSLFPPAITAGSQSFTLLLNGTNFQSNTTAEWNGIDRPVTFNDATTQVAMPVVDTDVANPGSAQLQVANPAPGGGLNPNAISFVIRPPAANGPVITQLNPSSAVAGGAGITLTVTADNLQSTDAITWNGTAFNTTTVGSPITALTATIPAEQLASQTVAGVAVATTTPGISSPSWRFPVGPSSNPSPRLSSLTPTTTAIKTLPPSGILVLKGSGFVPGSIVNFNGNPRPTGYTSATVLIVGVPAADVATGATFSVTVVNPSPGGGTSSSVSFSVQ
jgi:hypothetical protein